MSKMETGQVVRSAAEIYDEFFVPALFQAWTGRVLQVAGVEAGQHVLDVACGTGVLTRAAAERVGAAGSVVGLDVNEGMLAVARRKAPGMMWRQGVAEALPFDDDSFDAVVCQFGLMFFADPVKALAEMGRVLRANGRLTVAVWDVVENIPGYALMAEMIRRMFGEEPANGLLFPFSLGEQQRLLSLFQQAGFPQVELTTGVEMARFDSLYAWLHTEIRGWVLADVIDDEQFEQLLAEAEGVLRPFVADDGTVAFAAAGHVVTAVK